MKHAVMCTEDGVIAAHGIVERKAEDEFESFAGGPPGQLAPAEPPPGVEMRRLNQYLFQIAGPKTLHVLEKATGERLRDIGFLSFRDSTINGMKMEVARIGMTGNPAYELHVPIQEGPAIYQAVYEAVAGIWDREARLQYVHGQPCGGRISAGHVDVCHSASTEISHRGDNAKREPAGGFRLSRPRQYAGEMAHAG
jgi:hypothetical protein